MRDEPKGDETLRELAEEAMSDKRETVGGEQRTRELYDVPSEDAADLALDQDRDRPV